MSTTDPDSNSRSNLDEASQGGADRGSLLSALIEASARLRNEAGLYSDALAATLGLNRTDVACLTVLFLDGVATAGELAEATGLTTGGVSGVLDRLDRAGFVEREVDPRDRRRVRVRLTAEYRRRFDDIADRMWRMDTALTEDYTDHDLNLLLQHTQRSLAALRDETAALRLGRTEPAAPPVTPEVPDAPRAPEAPPPAETPAKSGAADTPRASSSSGEGWRATAAETFSAPLGDWRAATLELAAGGHTLVLQGDGAMPDLFRASFERRGAVVSATGSMVRVVRGGGAGTIVLNAQVRWTLRILGGSHRIKGELAEVPIAGIDISGGTARASFALSPPEGDVPIRITGGTLRMAFRRPSGTEARVDLWGGLTRLRVDGDDRGRTFRSDWETPGYASASDRYSIFVQGGWSEVELDEA